MSQPMDFYIDIKTSMVNLIELPGMELASNWSSWQCATNLR